MDPNQCVIAKLSEELKKMQDMLNTATASALKTIEQQKLEIEELKRQLTPPPTAEVFSDPAELELWNRPFSFNGIIKCTDLQSVKNNIWFRINDCEAVTGRGGEKQITITENVYNTILLFNGSTLFMNKANKKPLIGRQLVDFIDGRDFMVIDMMQVENMGERRSLGKFSQSPEAISIQNQIDRIITQTKSNVYKTDENEYYLWEQLKEEYKVEFSVANISQQHFKKCCDTEISGMHITNLFRLKKKYANISHFKTMSEEGFSMFKAMGLKGDPVTSYLKLMRIID